MHKIFNNPSDLKDYIFRIIQDDRTEKPNITIVFSDGKYVTITDNVKSSQTELQLGEHIDIRAIHQSILNGEQKDICLGNLSGKHLQIILSVANENNQNAFNRALIELNKHDRLARESVGKNTTLPSCAGTGIYKEHHLYYVKNSSDEIEDYGPYEKLEDAFAQTLPDRYSIAGPEYHATNNPSSLIAIN